MSSDTLVLLYLPLTTPNKNWLTTRVNNNNTMFILELSRLRPKTPYNCPSFKRAVLLLQLQPCLPGAVFSDVNRGDSNELAFISKHVERRQDACLW